ncbi:unnamed protein product, partial [Porites evermanni]
SSRSWEENSHIARPWFVSARQTITDGPVRAQEHSPSTRGAACGYGYAEDHWIIDGKHVKRGKRAHMITLRALFSLYLGAFLEGSPDVRRTLEELSTKVGDACKEGTKENIQTAHHSSTNAIQSSEVVKKMSDFDAANATNPLSTVFRRYMRMSALMHILEKAGGPSTNTQEITAGFKLAIVDGMAEVQSLDKPEWINNCRDLAEYFTNRLLVKYNDLQELHMIFDRYDVPSSLKSAT